MNTVPKEWLDFLREQYPAGSRIRLREMKDSVCPVPPGSMGTLECIDDIGTFHVKWDDGRSLGLVLGEDSFTVLPPPLRTLKLYMPMTVGYFDEEDESYEDEITLDSRAAVEYAPQVIAALQKERAWMERHADSPEEAERGLMAYYGKDDGVDRKVLSCHFTAEVRDGRLWGVAECKVQGELTPLELERLTDSVSGQASDGVGESFEQREIEVGGGLEIYAHLWQSSGWTIMPEQDCFDPHFPERLPELCWSVLPDGGPLVYIQKGESGYHASEDSSDRPSVNRHVADYRNKCRGISKAQEQAMLHGCQFGWDTPGADPKNYMEATGPKMGGLGT